MTPVQLPGVAAVAQSYNALQLTGTPMNSTLYAELSGLKTQSDGALSRRSAVAGDGSVELTKVHAASDSWKAKFVAKARANTGLYLLPRRFCGANFQNTAKRLSQ